LNLRQQAEIEDLYAKGWSTRRIAAHYGISKTTVLNVLKRRGVEMRPQGRTY
jgi:transposase